MILRMEKLVDPLNHQALDCYLKVCNNPLTIFDNNNDADDDDIDVYDGFASASRNRVAFDSTLGEDDHYISIGGRSRRQGTQVGA